MEVYFDTEFTGLHKNTTLISIGLVSDNDDYFYAEFTDYDRTQVDDWIKENVIKNLSSNIDFDIPCDVIKGNKLTIRKYLKRWLSQFDHVNFISDVCHYDFVLLIDLLGDTAFDMPSNCSPVCHDINEDISYSEGITIEDAFNVSREDLLDSYNIKIVGNKHNSLYDAMVIKEIYESL